MDPTMMMMNYPLMMPPTPMTMKSPVGNCPVFPTSTISPFFEGVTNPYGPFAFERDRHTSIWNVRNWMNWMSKELNLDLLKTESRPSNWTEYYNMENPIKIDNFGNRTFCVAFDMTTFRPDEIKVGIRNGRLVIEAQHEDKCEGTTPTSPEFADTIPKSCPSLLTKPGVVKRTFYREVTLPSDCNPNNVRAYITSEGMLTTTCPLPGMPVCPFTNITGYSTPMTTSLPATLGPLTAGLLASKHRHFENIMMPPPEMMFPEMMPGYPNPMMPGGFPVNVKTSLKL